LLNRGECVIDLTSILSIKASYKSIFIDIFKIIHCFSYNLNETKVARNILINNILLYNSEFK